MLDFILVDHPAFFPQACVGCGSQKGPLVDLHRELPGYGHVYACNSCAKSIARIMGYFPGKKLDELEAAGKALHAAHRELEHKAGRIDELTEHVNGLKTEKIKDSERIDYLEGRVEQLQSALRQEAEAALAAVGDA